MNIESDVSSELPTIANKSIYKITQETQKELRSFSLSSSRSGLLQAQVYLIDQGSYEIKRDEEIDTMESLEELADELPDNTPRYVVLSHPITTADGRKTYPYVMLYYLPRSADSKSKMLYAGATEMFRLAANVMKIIDVASVDDLDDVPSKLK